jgi:sulfatase maturation enzyme AslB (radical SAM superfamily)
MSIGNQLSVSPCCVSKTVPITALDFKNNQYLTKIRDTWRQGIFPAECKVCEQSETNKLVSRRQGSNSWYQDHKQSDDKVELVRMDYWTGNLCNLACVICGPHNSSLWRQELKYTIESRRATINKFWRTLDLSNLQYIHFNGGEPLLSKEHVEFLNEIPNKHQVCINYNTNATVLPDQNLLDLWSKFQLVQLDFSIDDIGARFEYQRYPANWNQVTENLQWFIDNALHNCMFAVNTSVGILNQHNLDNLNTWLKQNFHTSRFTDPIEHRQQLTDGIFALNNAKEQVIKFLNECDTRRGTNWKITFPELVDFYTRVL